MDFPSKDLMDLPMLFKMGIFYTFHKGFFIAKVGLHIAGDGILKKVNGFLLTPP